MNCDYHDLFHLTMCVYTCVFPLSDALWRFIFCNNSDEIPSAMNSPASWDSNSMHDAALFTILNMSVIPAARQYLREEDAVHILSLIADYRKPRSSSGSIIAGVPSTPMHDNDTTTHSELKQQQLQSLKAVRYVTKMLPNIP
jgi:hypothetical protein